MKEVEIDIDEFKKPDDMLDFLRQHKVDYFRNSNIHFVYHHDANDMQVINFLVVFSAAYIFVFETSKNKSFDKLIEEYTAQYLKRAFTNQKISLIEKKIEKDLHLNLSFKKKKEKEDPLDELFGLWKGKNITIDSLREKAWPKRK